VFAHAHFAAATRGTYDQTRMRAGGDSRRVRARFARVLDPMVSPGARARARARGCAQREARCALRRICFKFALKRPDNRRRAASRLRENAEKGENVTASLIIDSTRQVAIVVRR